MKLFNLLMLIATLCLAAPATASADTPTSVQRVYQMLFQVRTLPAVMELLFEPQSDQEQITCLAMNVYHEARGTTLADQRAVALVTQNRLRDGRWAHTTCGVVWQRSQFSWTAMPMTRHIPRENEAWLSAQRTAYQVYLGQQEDITRGATHFYAASMSRPPAWAAQGVDKQRIGGHIYMRR